MERFCIQKVCSKVFSWYAPYFCQTFLQRQTLVIFELITSSSCRTVLSIFSQCETKFLREKFLVIPHFYMKSHFFRHGTKRMALGLLQDLKKQENWAIFLFETTVPEGFDVKLRNRIWKFSKSSVFFAIKFFRELCEFNGKVLCFKPKSPSFSSADLGLVFRRNFLNMGLLLIKPTAKQCPIFLQWNSFKNYCFPDAGQNFDQNLCK